jgi:flagellar FliJ protein
MGQAMKAQSQFCTTAILNEVSDPNRDRVQDQRAVERFQRIGRGGIEDTRRRIAQMDAIVADFDRTANELEGWIKVEENRTRIQDPVHFAYSAAATAMRHRRDALKRSRETLMRSIDELKRQLADADCHV